MLAFTKRELYICGALLLFLLVAPFVFVNFKLQLAFMLILIILAMTWNIQGGEMGYNSFGNIMFFWSRNVFVCEYANWFIFPFS